MQPTIEEFLLKRRAENASPNTLRAYRADLEQLAQFIGGGEDWYIHLSRAVVRGFLAWLSKREGEDSTRARKLCAVKAFVFWLRGEDFLTDESFDGITSLRRMKIAKKLPDVPSEEEMATFLNGPFPTAFPERDKLICELLYSCGLRVSEAANIRLTDMRPEQSAILIHGKGGMYGKAAKLRLVPLNRVSQAALDEYLIARAKVLAGHELRNLETDVLFFAVRNRYAKGPSIEPIDVRSIRRLVLYMTQVRGLRPMHPHLLRHACATHLLDHGCPLDVIAKVLGHDNLDITAHYAQVSTRLMTTAYNGAHPHAREPAA
jgi:integrase/recombinase XerC